MPMVRLLIILSTLMVGVSAAETIVMPVTLEVENQEQCFIFGKVDGIQIAFADESIPIPELGLLYRNKTQNHGYDVTLNTLSLTDGGELAATYNLYAPTKYIQPYIGMGAGVAVFKHYKHMAALGVVPVVVGVSSKIFFADVGLSTYLGPHGEKPPNPIVLIVPEARVGLGFQF